MNIKTLSNFDLENTLKKKVSLERQISVEIISLLEGASTRRLYLQKGFGSLIEYCIGELGYSESSAYRRISAMRVVKEVPQVKAALAEGRLNLVNVARAQTLFQKEAKKQKALSCVEKSKILKTLENQSSRQAEKILLQISPEPLPQEKIREISPTHTQVSLVFSEGLIQKLSDLKHLLSHKNPNPSTTELIELLADMVLKKLKMTDGPEKSTLPREPIANKVVANSMTVALGDTNAGATVRKFKRAYISVTLKRKIWQKAQGKCQYQDSKNKKQCGSKFQLQIEHKRPVAKGGQNNEENLELFCAAHNRLRATEQYGKSHMQNFFWQPKHC